MRAEHLLMETEKKVIFLIDFTAFKLSMSCCSGSAKWLASDKYSGINVCKTAQRVPPLLLDNFLSDCCGLDTLSCGK